MSIAKQLTEFKGVLMNGFLINDPRFVTTISLLFENVYIPNNLEFVISFAQKNKIISNLDSDDLSMNFTAIDTNEMDNNPLKDLSKEELKTAHYYLFHSHQFCINYHELFPNVLKTDLIKDNKVFDIELVKKGGKGKQNTYKAKMNPMNVTLGDFDNIKKELDSNSVPIISSMANISQLKTDNNIISNKSIAAILAMKSVEMLLPSFKGIKPELILETRDKLSNHLPVFWSTMLKFSVEAKEIMNNAGSLKEGMDECQNIVDSTIRPVLIDINRKLEMERRNWFYKILTPVARSIKMIVGKPGLTTQDLMTASLSLSSNIALDYVSHKRKIEQLQDEAGFMYMFELEKIVNNRK